MPSQNVQGKIIGSQEYKTKKGSKGKQTWWTLLFDPPAPRTLSCVTEEVVLMKLSYMNWHGKMTQLAKEVGKKVVVRWTMEDSDLSMTEWNKDVRVCVVSKYLQRPQQVVLNFKCGYDKFVSADTFIQLLEESFAFHRCAKKKTRDNVAFAMKE